MTTGEGPVGVTSTRSQLPRSGGGSSPLGLEGADVDHELEDARATTAGGAGFGWSGKETVLQGILLFLLSRVWPPLL